MTSLFSNWKDQYYSTHTSHQFASQTVTFQPILVVTLLVGVNRVLWHHHRRSFTKPLFLCWIMECARRISGRSIRWHQPCDALGNWVKVRDRAKEIAEDRWPVNARGVGFWLVSQAGVKVVAWTKEILESLPMPSISRVGWRKLWKITPKHHGEDKAIVNKEKQIIANRSKICRKKILGSKPESNF